MNLGSSYLSQLCKSGSTIFNLPNTEGVFFPAPFHFINQKRLVKCFCTICSSGHVDVFMSKQEQMVFCMPLNSNEPNFMLHF